jgi:mRNA interferase MazF
VDLGLAAKVRPCLVFSIPPSDSDRALVTLIAHTTSVRGLAFEVPIQARYLKPGAFDAQNVTTIPRAKLIRLLGRLDTRQLEAVEIAVIRWLGLVRTSRS